MQDNHRTLSRFALAAVALGFAASCDGSGAGIGPNGMDRGGTGDGAVFIDGATVPADRGMGLIVDPPVVRLTVRSGQALPTAQVKAFINGSEVTALWVVDQRDLATISESGVVSPSGSRGGDATITAIVGSAQATAVLQVTVDLSQNGATEQNGNPGPGGFGGVGGEGLGPAIGGNVKALLDGQPTADSAFRMLYPYSGTVWPLGILAPLLQWSMPTSDAGEGVRVELSAKRFSFVGYFGRPVALAAGAPLQRHPIPQNVWTAATRSAAGGALSVRVILASGGKVYGPIEAQWTVAPGSLRGTVYYQSYGTNLVKNFDGAIGGDGRFGAATLAIRGGSTDPVLVAGSSGTEAQCRVCHSVSANGARMVVQHGDDYTRSSAYDLLAGNRESPYARSTDGNLGWIGMTPDGALGLKNAAPIAGGANLGDTGLYEMDSGTIVSATGLNAFVTKAGFPMFSPDGQRVVFSFNEGAGDGVIAPGDGTTLVAMSVDLSSRSFSNPSLLYNGTAASRPGWPAFWPTGEGVVFEVERAINRENEYFSSRYGGRGELFWSDVGTGRATALDQANGRGHAPTGPNNHEDDATLNYEPTVSPIASGGYAWVVFVSRRMYGNVATIDPWASDPRDHDLTKAATTKKLWVAALDLHSKPGVDPSHPAFYLPGQELLAGNTRGFWVLDPCKGDGLPCTGGDECCNGYCAGEGAGAAPVCGKGTAGCSKEFDRCGLSAQCCEYPKYACVNERCARIKVD